jgi:hypothetical protein
MKLQKIILLVKKCKKFVLKKKENPALGTNFINTYFVTNKTFCDYLF